MNELVTKPLHFTFN